MGREPAGSRARAARAAVPALAFAAVLLVLVLRAPHLVVDPQLVWEDGAFFLARALAAPLLDNVLTRYEGYYLPLPFLVAATVRVETLPTAPLVFAAASLMIEAFCLSVPVARWFDGVLPLRWRLVLVGLAALAPRRSEAMGNLASVHFYGFCLLAWLTLADWSRIRARHHLWLVPSAVALLVSTAYAVLLLPVLAFRLVAERTRGLRHTWFPLGLTTVALAYAGVIIATLGQARFAGGHPLSAPLGAVLRFAVKTLGFNVALVTTFGEGLAHSRLASPMAYVPAFVVLMAILAGGVASDFRRARGERIPSLRLSGAAYYVVAPVVLIGLARPFYVQHFVVDDQYWGADRYFLVPSLMYLTVAVSLFAGLVRRLPRAAARRAAYAAAACLGGVVVTANFRYAPLPDARWREHVAEYYRQLLATAPGAPDGQFAITTFPGPPWEVRLRVFSPAGKQRARIDRALRALERSAN